MKFIKSMGSAVIFYSSKKLFMALLPLSILSLPGPAFALVGSAPLIQQNGSEPDDNIQNDADQDVKQGDNASAIQKDLETNENHKEEGIEKKEKEISSEESLLYYQARSAETNGEYRAALAKYRELLKLTGPDPLIANNAYFLAFEHWDRANFQHFGADLLQQDNPPAGPLIFFMAQNWREGDMKGARAYANALARQTAFRSTAEIFILAIDIYEGKSPNNPTIGQGEARDKQIANDTNIADRADLVANTDSGIDSDKSVNLIKGDDSNSNEVEDYRTLANLYTGHLLILRHLVDDNPDKAVALFNQGVIPEGSDQRYLIEAIARHYIADKQPKKAEAIYEYYPEDGYTKYIRERLNNRGWRKYGHKVDHKRMLAILLTQLTSDFGQYSDASILLKFFLMGAFQLDPDYEMARITALAIDIRLNRARNVTGGENTPQIIGDINGNSLYAEMFAEFLINHYRLKKDYTTASTLIHQYLGKRKSRLRKYINLFYNASSEKKWVEANQWSKKTVEEASKQKLDNKELANYWSIHGETLVELGQWDAAKMAYEKALSLAPRAPLTLNNYGYFMIERREDIDRALSMIEKAYSLNKNDSSIQDSLGWVYYLIGKPEAGLKYLEEAREGDKFNSVVNEHLGDVYWALGRKIEARFAWAAALVEALKTDRDRIEYKHKFGYSEKYASP